MCVLAVSKIIQDVPASQDSWDPSRMCRFGCDNVAQACAQSYIANSSLLGSFGAGLGRDGVIEETCQLCLFGPTMPRFHAAWVLPDLPITGVAARES